jgi:elongation factor 3
MHHLEEHLDDSPLEYITSRFKMGQDKELAKMQTLELTEEEVELTKKRGEICDVVGRQLRAKVLTYECVKTGRNKRDGTPDPVWLGRPELEKSYPPYVMKLVRNYDETVKAMSAGLDIRPLTYAVCCAALRCFAPQSLRCSRAEPVRRSGGGSCGECSYTEIKAHLAQFGIDEELASGKVKRMSGGQKSRLVLAVRALLSPPHLNPAPFLSAVLLLIARRGRRRMTAWHASVTALHLARHPCLRTCTCVDRFVHYDRARPALGMLRCGTSRT